MKELITFLIQKITGSTDFEVTETQEEGRIIMSVKAEPKIIGMIIGSGGKMVKNLRRIAGIKGVLENTRVDIDVTEK